MSIIEVKMLPTGTGVCIFLGTHGILRGGFQILLLGKCSKVRVISSPGENYKRHSTLSAIWRPTY